jgi:hypothetical protein
MIPDRQVPIQSPKRPASNHQLCIAGASWHKEFLMNACARRLTVWHRPQNHRSRSGVGYTNTARGYSCAHDIQWLRLGLWHHCPFICIFRLNGDHAIMSMLATMPATMPQIKASSAVYSIKRGRILAYLSIYLYLYGIEFLVTVYRFVTRKNDSLSIYHFYVYVSEYPGTLLHDKSVDYHTY